MKSSSGTTSLLSQGLPSSSRSSSWKRRALSDSLASPLDRVNVLNGHSGCVNALSWARDGEILLSGGDDQTVRIWRVDARDTETAYPLVCRSVIHTGHTANIFNAQMLPYSSRIVTVAGDDRVGVFDVRDGTDRVSSNGNDTEEHVYARTRCIRLLECHSDRVKRIVTEESPDLFLTVSEDGTVRQHDLRTAHNCAGEECPAPIVKLPVSLMTISLSPLTPYQFVVGGTSPYGYLFDRRHVGRYLEEEWGLPPAIDQATTCVRRFGRLSRAPGERKGYEHITGTRMSATNGHEVLLSYSGDAVYLYSTTDDPDSTPPSPAQLPSQNNENVSEPIAQSEGAEPSDIEEDDQSADDPDEEMADEAHESVPVVLPRSRFAGACNVRTVKDVNFFGPHDEYVVSGSDDGNWFIWQKSTGALHDILEGDGSVVNVIEGHPNLPLAAVSGIDHTVKLFAPTHEQSKFSRLREADAIIKRNTDASRHRYPDQIDIGHILLEYGLALRVVAGGNMETGDIHTQCRHQ